MKKDNTHIKKELEKLKVSKLVQFFDEKQDIPEVYFENLSETVFDKINEEKKQAKKLSYKNLFLPLSIAAALIVFFVMPALNNSNKQLNWSQVSQNDIQNYIEQNIEEFSEEEIASVSNLKNYSIFNNTDYSNQELEEFLLEEDIQEEELF